MDDLKKILNYIDNLEKRIHQLEDQTEQPSFINAKSIESDTSQLSSKMQARLELMHTIRQMYPGLFVTAAKRKDGGGLLLTPKATNQNFTMKFYRSKNYSLNRLFAWFSIRSDDLFEKPNDFYVMSVSYEEKNHTFLFDYETLMKLVQHKKSIQREKHGQETDESIIHFYIEEKHGSYMETREINQSLDKERGMIEGGLDVSYAYNNFSIIEKITSATHLQNQNALTTTSNPQVIKNMIDEILHQEFLIPLKSNDYYYKGNPILLIQFQPDDDIQLESNIFESLKRVILHIETNKKETLHVIQSIKNKVMRHTLHIPLYISVSLTQEKETKATLICIGEYTID